MKTKNLILGAIIGDVIGSVYEWNNVKSTNFELFNTSNFLTDDSIMTIATMDCILNNYNYAIIYKQYGLNYPGKGYGGRFQQWLESDSFQAYNSWGNGSAMRVSPVGWAYNNIEDVLNYAKLSAEVTHNHNEGIKGAQASATAIFLARMGKSKLEIKKYIEETFRYNLNRKIDEIRPNFQFDESCQGTVPESIIAFLESDDFESAIRLAISLGGDSDTIACITGSIAEAFYKEIPNYIIENVYKLVPIELKQVIENFSEKYGY